MTLLIRTVENCMKKKYFLAKIFYWKIANLWPLFWQSTCKLRILKSGLHDHPALFCTHNKQILTYCNRSLMKIDVHHGIPFLIWKTAFANSRVIVMMMMRESAAEWKCSQLSPLKASKSGLFWRLFWPSSDAIGSSWTWRSHVSNKVTSIVLLLNVDIKCWQMWL